MPAEVDGLMLIALEALLAVNDNNAVVVGVRREMTKVQQDLTVARLERDTVRSLLREARDDTEKSRRSVNFEVGLEGYATIVRELATSALDNMEWTVARDATRK